MLAQVEGVGQAGRGGLTSLSSCRAHEHVPIFCEFSSRLAAFSARSLLPSERHLRGTIANVVRRLSRSSASLETITKPFPIPGSTCRVPARRS